MFDKLRKSAYYWWQILVVWRKPIPGKDALWIGYCFVCNDFTNHASRNGYRVGGLKHCYHCGSEAPIACIPEAYKDSMIAHSRNHWLHFPIIPYNIHKLRGQR